MCDLLPLHRLDELPPAVPEQGGGAAPADGLMRVTVLQNSTSFHAPAIYLAALDDAVKGAFGADSGVDGAASSIVATSQPLLSRCR